jgi:hypothetical protein
MMTKTMMIFWFAALLLACQAQAQTVHGSWKVDVATSLSLSGTQAVFDSYPEARQTRVAELFGTRVFTFSTDGTMQVSWSSQGQPQHLAGTYEAGAGQLSLTMDGATHQWVIEQLTENILSVTLMTTTPGLFTKLYLTRKE